jgi:hypothetical protein
MKTSIESPFHEAHGTPGSASKNPSVRQWRLHCPSSRVTGLDPLINHVICILLQSKSFTAYDDTKKARVSQLSNVWKIWMVCGDCFLIGTKHLLMALLGIIVTSDCVGSCVGLAPVLVHMAKDEHGTYSFSPVSVNLLVEIAKTIFALGTLVMYGSGRPGPPLYKSISSFYKDAYHNRLLAIPAALYAVNNYLKFVMQLYFKPTTAKMLSNLKVRCLSRINTFACMHEYIDASLHCADFCDCSPDEECLETPIQRISVGSSLPSRRRYNSQST